MCNEYSNIFEYSNIYPWILDIKYEYQSFSKRIYSDIHKLSEIYYKFNIKFFLKKEIILKHVLREMSKQNI